MKGLPILQKNAYLSVLVKDNALYANLAYTDYSNDTVYILHDYTDLYPLRRRLDDNVFGVSFWSEYFNELGIKWDWDLVEESNDTFLRFLDFKDEFTGITGIKVIIDDNQKFLTEIYNSLKEFSNQIAIRISDDGYIRELLDHMSKKLQYDDIFHLDIDLPEFSAYRLKGKEFTKGMISWDSEISLIDSIKNSKIQALMSTDTSSNETLNKYANFVLRPYNEINDPVLRDILRSFTTIQNLSIYNENKKKFFGIGWEGKSTAIFLTGRLAEILPLKDILLSLLDGLELLGDFDLYIDRKGLLYSYGRSMALGRESFDVILGKHEVLPKAIKVYIPELHQKKSKNKLVFKGSFTSTAFDKEDVFSINPEVSIFDVPDSDEKIVFEAELENGAEGVHGDKKMELVSTRELTLYDKIVVDARIKPIVYGPDTYANRNKLKSWFDEGKR